MSRMRSRCSSARHRERDAQRARALLDVVGVDDQRLGSSREAPANCDRISTPLLVVVRGDELLGHEVHAVVQAAHDADVGSPRMVLVHGVGLVVLVQQDDRRMRGMFGIQRVDLGDAPVHTLGVVLVVGDGAPRRRGDLDEREAPTHSGCSSNRRATALQRSMMPLV